MATLGTAFTAGYFGLRGGKKQDKAKGPPINAGSQDEEKFIKYVYTMGTCRNWLWQCDGQSILEQATVANATNSDFIMKQEASKKH